MAVLGNVLTVWKGLSNYFIAGTDPTDFSCDQYTASTGQGLVAPKGIVTAGNLIYLAMQDGIYTFDGQQLQKISDPIGPYLIPVLNEDRGTIAASAYANIAFAYHGGRLLVFAPSVGDASNTVAHVYDNRLISQAWSGWTGRWTGMNMTSAVAIGNIVDDPDIWCGGQDGMIYRLTGNGDTLTSGQETPNAVSFALTTRAYARPPQGLTIWLQGRYNMPLGIENRAWMPWFLRARGVRFWIDVNSYDQAGPQAVTLTAGALYAQQGTAKTTTVAATGRKRIVFRLPPDRGDIGLEMTLSGSTANNLQIFGTGMTVARGSTTN